MNSPKPMDNASADNVADEIESSRESASDSAPWSEAIATGLCAVLGVIGFSLQHSGIENAFSWSLVPLIGAYLAGGIRTTWYAIHSLIKGELNVDTLMIIAAIGAAILGDWVEGVVLLFLFSLSGTLEKFASYRTNRSIEALIQLRPRMACRVAWPVPSGEAVPDEVIGVEHLQINEVVRVKPGERFPVDGLVVDGESWADESTLTGESRPIRKPIGADVFSGTMNSQGTVLVKMTKRIADSTIERIVHMVHEAQSQKTPSQKFVESWQQPYVIAVLVGATLIFFGTRWVHTNDWSDAFYHAMVVLVAASPCAVVLSSPAVMLSAIALAGRHGVLVKGAVHLEQLGQIDALAMDKTGTITLGHPKVSEVWTPAGCDVAKLIGYAALVEKQSEHPLAIPIIEELASRGLVIPNDPVRDFHSHTGLGVHGSVNGVWVGIGKEKLFEGHGIPFPAIVAENVDRLRLKGQTALPVVTSDPLLAGVIGVADPLRPDTAQTLLSLKRLGIPKIVLLTGDHANVAQAVTKGLPLDEIYAGLLPEDKVKHLLKLSHDGKLVAMVGDGVNDAPALATADIGIAMGGGGTDVALEVADVVLMRDDLAALPAAIWIGRVAHRRVRQNMVFAFSMICILVLASFFSLPMWLGVLGHEGSTLLVVFNGVRMLWERVPKLDVLH